MDKKQIIVDKMQSEFDLALKFPTERVQEDRPLTLQYVFKKLKESFEDTFIPEHILDIILEHDEPLLKYYDIDCYFI